MMRAFPVPQAPSVGPPGLPPVSVCLQCLSFAFSLSLLMFLVSLFRLFCFFCTRVRVHSKLFLGGLLFHFLGLAPPPLSLPACKSAYSLACSLAYSLTYCHVFSPLSFFSFFPSDLVWHDLLHFVFPLCMRSSRCRLQLVQCIYLAHKTCFTCIFLFEGYDALSYDVYCFVLLFFLRYSSAPELLEPVLCPRTGFLAMSYRCNVRTLTCDL